jgi:hypothetical protein
MFALRKPLEHHTQPLLPRALFYRRLLSYAFIAFLLILFALGIGVLGYRYFEGLSWLDALLNASMILGGMGPVNELHTNGGKLFASFYALFSGIAFLAIAGTLIAPIAHRFLHRLHIEMAEDSSAG